MLAPWAFMAEFIATILEPLAKLQGTSNKSHEILMFVSERTPNNTVTPQSLLILIVLVDDKIVVNSQALMFLFYLCD